MVTSGRLKSSASWELPFVYPAPPEAPVRAKRFADLGWSAGPDEKAQTAVAIDVGLENLCGSTFERGHDEPTSVFMPTCVKAGDPHAFRTLERSSFETGTHALAFWPSDRVLRGYNGTLRLSSQIGLVDFPADHAIAGLILKVAESRAKDAQELVLTLPTFLPLDRVQRIRETVGQKSKIKLYGTEIPGSCATAYFYLYPSLGGPRVRSKAAKLTEWSDPALKEGRLLIWDWGASGLSYGLVTVEGKEGRTELRQLASGSWPSLGGHRLTLAVFHDLKIQLTDLILQQGPANLRLRHDVTRRGEAFRPPLYDQAFEPISKVICQRQPRSIEALRLRNALFPTRWHLDDDEEQEGYAPLKKVAIAHFKKLWQQAETIKKTVLSDPEKHATQTIAWDVQALDSPFVEHLKGEVIYDARPFLRRVHSNLLKAFRHADETVSDTTRGRPVTRFAFSGMQGSSRLLADTLVQFAAGGAGQKPKAFVKAHLAPCAELPIELRSIANRGAALIRRDADKVRIAPTTDMLPFAIRICDAVGDVEIFRPGPTDELRLFQRRLHVESGSPQYEFFAYESACGTVQGAWGAIDFSRPEEFTAEDRKVKVDERFKFGPTGTELPVFRKWQKNTAYIKKCFDRHAPPQLDGKISLRHWIPHDEPDALRLMTLIESELVTTFRKKVYLLEREFEPPPPRHDYVYQRYYLSRSQELIVVREWWAPPPGDRGRPVIPGAKKKESPPPDAPVTPGRLVRHKTLHVFVGSAEAKNILGIDWGRH
jgi:hypothetical protein